MLLLRASRWFKRRDVNTYSAFQNRRFQSCGWQLNTSVEFAGFRKGPEGQLNNVVLA